MREAERGELSTRSISKLIGIVVVVVIVVC